MPPHDASKVKVSGPGIDDGILASLPTEFTVDTTDAGVADLDVAIQVINGSYLIRDYGIILLCLPAISVVIMVQNEKVTRQVNFGKQHVW